MKLTRYLTATALMAGVLLGQQGKGHQGMMGQGTFSAKDLVEVKGAIERVQIAPGQGMPFLEVKEEKGTVKVYLGSMRYLMEKDFSPKAGSKVVVKGFKRDGDVLAKTVEIPAEKQRIELRSEDGTPLWRMGRYGKQKE